MGYCRKIVGTYLRIKGIEPETIDLLQGGIPKSIFTRHYFRPDFDYQCKKVRLELASLHSMIVMSIVPKIFIAESSLSGMFGQQRYRYVLLDLTRAPC